MISKSNLPVDLISINELRTRRNKTLEKYMSDYSIGLSSLSLCLHIRVCPNYEETLLDFDNLEDAMAILEDYAQNSEGEELKIELMITRLDTINSVDDYKILLSSYFLK